eukprot:TRINITY_DN18574_c0_g1_i1.p1 TRINITY_DN18574_c0_g1~~TRINITY_DN18574_c0_g1_i1.p1  ORF type:complete len:263 (-),score=63.11 TRINITY_DN18574_c0_g1_i1:214-1002(-)
MHSQNSYWNERVIIVTGGGSGIGRTTSVELARLGARVAVVDINETGGRKTVDLIKTAGGRAMFVSCDVSNAQSVEQMVAKVVSEFGVLHGAFNNAGIGGVHMKAHEYPESEFDKLTAINLKGVWLCLKYQVAQMLRQGGEGYSIVNNSSLSGLVAYRLNAPYSAVKHGVIGLTKSAAIEYGRSGIRVNCVCPGFTPTPILDSVADSMGLPSELVQQTLAKRVPMNRLATELEVARAAIFLLSDQSTFTTGHALEVSGGLASL